MEDILNEIVECLSILAAGVGTYERKNPNIVLRTDLNNALDKIEYIKRQIKAFDFPYEGGDYS